MTDVRDYDLVDYLSQTRELGGSDLHITVGAPPLARVHGQLMHLHETPLEAEITREIIFAALKETQRAKLESEWELDFALQVENIGRFRGNAHYAQGNVEAAFRHIPDEIPDLENLGHSPILQKLCNIPQGLLLVTGITGSGKSTTLAAMAQRILQTRSAVIVTIEDPIEFVFNHAVGMVKQREVGSDTHAFHEALRRSMRQDPDVIIVSEMRDLETIQTAITAAETGHLVISTLHTMDAPNTIDRLIDVFPGDQQQQIATQLANCLIGVISQRLLKREGDVPGRVMASELMLLNQGIKTCIRERKLEQILGLLEIGAAEGMHTMDHSLSELASAGLISLQDALTYARDKNFVKQQYKEGEAAQKTGRFWQK